MGGDRQLLTGGITTFQLAVGLSAITRLTMASGVLANEIVFYSGGTLFVMGASIAVASGITTGVFVPLANGLLVDGPSDIYMVAGGAATTVHVIRYLGQGFAGQY